MAKRGNENPELKSQRAPGAFCGDCKSNETGVFMKKSIQLVFLILCGLLLAFSPSGASESVGKPEDVVVAEVNGVKLTERDLTDVFREMIPQTSYHGTISAEKIEAVKQEALDELIKRELYYQEAKRQKLKVDSAKVKERYAGIENRFRNKEEFKKALEAEGLTEKELKASIEKLLLVNRLYDEEVVKKAAVSESFLRDYYKKNQDNFMRPESIHLRHIIIKVSEGATPKEREEMKARAEEVARKAKAGEDFAQLAWDYSMDQYAVKGGDIGFIHKGRLTPEVEKAAFSLKPGEVSDVIQTKYGYHIIKVEEKIPSTKLTFDEAKGNLKKELEEKNTKELYESLNARLKAAAVIKVFYKGSK